jgi:antitoxin CcdA
MLATSTRKALNLKIDSSLVQEARELDINLSREFEAHLADVVRLRKQGKWLAENREALEAYNAHVERDGVFSDGLRGF